VAHSFSNVNIQGQGGQPVKVKIKINVTVRVNPVQITARYSHSSRKTKPNPNTKRNMCTRKLDISPARKQYRSGWSCTHCVQGGPVRSPPMGPADRPNAHNISTFIPSSRRPGRINPTPDRHDHRAVAIHSLYITAKVLVP